MYFLKSSIIARTRQGTEKNPKKEQKGNLKKRCPFSTLACFCGFGLFASSGKMLFVNMSVLCHALTF